MSFCVDLVSEDSFYENITLGVTKLLADQILPVGSIRVNSLNELFLSPALKDLLDFSFTRQNTGPRPVLNTKSKVFELDSCRTIGKVGNENTLATTASETGLNHIDPNIFKISVRQHKNVMRQSNA
ncbi:hypothetical protein MSG28_002088 [Choristoneura fumiferana]|uniref:Uncharacterized protein n=1 Tax=Choristoneura fumiferana TaxID=7141 RepID=A0ACC0JTV5_CHOFU|nr:hypothetical protein MSG28_002088 [Choristoneura fumiferana]